MAETESDIVRIAREYRAQLERNETDAMKEMSRAWVRMERTMRSEFEALAVIISEKAEAGEPVPAQFVYSLKRYQEMLIQLRAEIAKYNNTAEDIIKDKQRENIKLGLDGAGEQLTVSAPVGIEWVKIYPEAAENMVGYAADGSPLKALLERDYQSGAQAVADALIDGVGLGKGWKAVASDMEKAVGMSFDRSVTIARTEMARAYRQANMRQYEASGVVEKVFRLAYKPTACFACLILDGTEIKGEFEDHPRGKCTSIVQTIGGHRPTWQTGQEWFMEQSADDQRRLMGAGRWELWKDGVIKSLSDFVYIRPNQSWGGSPAVKTFDMLGVQSPLKQPKPAAGMQTVEADTFDRANVKYSLYGRALKSELDNAGVEYREVRKHTEQLSEEEIIERLAGGDKTSGSCASLALAYAGNKNGLDVLDFRGGASRSIFSTARTYIAEMRGVISKSEVGRGIRAAKKLLAQMEDGKEYILSTGSHAAVCRIRNGVTEYLELQSPTRSGWIPFEHDETINYSKRKKWVEHYDTDVTLERRFGCAGGQDNSVLFDIASFAGSDEFRDILGYINTAPEAQGKGAGGEIK